MKFLSGEARATMKYVEASIEHAVSVGELADVQATFGARFAETLEQQAFITRLNGDGQIIFPEKLAGTNKVPIVALRPGESTAVPRAWNQTPYQAECSGRKLEAWGIAEVGEGLVAARALVEDMKRYYLQQGIKQRFRAMSEDHAGVTYRPNVEATFPYATKIGKHRSKIFSLRPIIALRRYGSFASPLVVYHEWEHAMQAYQEPVQAADKDAIRLDSYRRELGAYHVHSVLFHVLKKCGYTPPEGMSGGEVFTSNIKVPGFTAVDILRRETNSGRSDKFFPNGTLIKELDKLGLDIIGN